MPRGKQAVKRQILPDPKYNSLLVAKFTNMVMQEGKKTIAQSIVYVAMENLAKVKNDTNALKLFSVSTHKSSCHGWFSACLNMAIHLP